GVGWRAGRTGATRAAAGVPGPSSAIPPAQLLSGGVGAGLLQPHVGTAYAGTAGPVGQRRPMLMGAVGAAAVGLPASPSSIAPPQILPGVGAGQSQPNVEPREAGAQPGSMLPWQQQLQPPWQQWTAQQSAGTAVQQSAAAGAAAGGTGSAGAAGEAAAGLSAPFSAISPPSIFQGIGAGPPQPNGEVGSAGGPVQVGPTGMTPQVGAQVGAQQSTGNDTRRSWCCSRKRSDAIASIPCKGNGGRWHCHMNHMLTNLGDGFICCFCDKRSKAACMCHA
ncbi:unnamed protein product, partial [Pylaiella littoralis]